MRDGKRVRAGFSLIELGAVLVGMSVISLVLMGAFKTVYEGELRFLKRTQCQRDTRRIHSFMTLFWKGLRVSKDQPLMGRSWDDGSWFIGAPFWDSNSPFLIQPDYWHLLYFHKGSEEAGGGGMYIRANSLLINRAVLEAIENPEELESRLSSELVSYLYTLEGLDWMRLWSEGLFDLGTSDGMFSFPQDLLSDEARSCQYCFKFKDSEPLCGCAVAMPTRFYADNWDPNVAEGEEGDDEN